MNHRYYKFLFLFFMLISSQGILYAQNQGGMKIGNNPMLINPAAILEIETTNKGILLPRIQDTAIINVFNPPDGLMVYVIDAQNKQQLYIRHAKAWAEIQTSDNITGNVTTILNNAFGKKSISSVDGTITVIGGDTAVFRNVVLLVNKSKVVTDSAVANVMVSSLVLDSLAKAVGAKPLSDSIISLIDKHLLANA